MRPASTLLWLAVGTAVVGTVYYFATRPKASAAPTGYYPPLNTQPQRPAPSGFRPPIVPQGGPSPFPSLRLPETVDINNADPATPIAMRVNDRLLARVTGGWSLAAPPNPQVLAPLPDGVFVARGTGTAQLAFLDADGKSYPPYTVVVSA